MMGLAYK